MAYDVKVNIDLTKPVGKVGSGMPLLLMENAAAEIAYTEISGIDEAVGAGIDIKSDAYKAIQLLFAQRNAPKTIALCAVSATAAEALADPLLVGKSWRQLIVINASEEDAASTVTSISAAVEALDGKMYFAGMDTDDDTAFTVNGLRRTVLFYCDATEAVPYPVAALVGETAGRVAGSFTYKNLILSGVEAQELTDVEIEAIHAKGGLTFVEKAGDAVTTEGKVAGGEYIDIIDCEDYIIQQITVTTQKILNNADKVLYDNNGIGLLETATVNVLQDAYNNGMIATNAEGGPDYSVSFVLREDTKEADRAARRYLGGNFTFALAGAIHEVVINGTINV